MTRRGETRVSRTPMRNIMARKKTKTKKKPMAAQLKAALPSCVDGSLERPCFSRTTSARSESLVPSVCTASVAAREEQSIASFVLVFISGISLGGTRHPQVLEFWNHVKGVGGHADCVCELIDSLGRNVAEKLSCDSNVRDSGRVKPHQPRTGGIRRHRIICQDNSVEWPWMSS